MPEVSRFYGIVIQIFFRDHEPHRERLRPPFAAKGCLSHKTALAMVFKLVMAASKTWQRLNGYEALPPVVQGVQFTDGIQADETETRAAA